MSNHHPCLAMIGAGYWGKNLVRNYHALGSLKLVCETDPTALSTLRSQYPDVEFCSGLSEVLPREDISGVIIATPAETHFPIAREALLAGKHVFVEKPLVLEENHGEELIALAGEKNRVLMVGHLLRYHPAFVRLKELADSGELGRINYIYSHRLNLGKIRREENILWSFAPHDISMILSLVGEGPEYIHATGGYYLHQKIADVTTTHLEFPSGLKAHIFVSWLHPFKEQKLVVVGDRKMAVFDDTQPWPDKLLLYPHRIEWQNHMPVPAKGEPERVDIPNAEPLRNECEHFVQCLRDGLPPLTDGHEGLRVLKILNAAQHSLDNHGSRISLDHHAQPVGTPDAERPSPDREDVPQPPPTPEKSYFVHETAVIDARTEIGSGTKIWHFSHILSGSKLGENCNVGQNVVIGPDVTIGRGCKVQNNVSIYKGVVLQDDVFCGPSMVFTNVFNPRAHIRRMDELRPTVVQTGATMGANCTIVCGVTIGHHAFVGAGAVVVRDVPAHALVLGNPARQTGWMCTCGEKLNASFHCASCGNTYRREGTGLVLEGREE